MKRKTKAWRRARMEARTMRHESKRRAKRKAARQGQKTQRRSDDDGQRMGLIRRGMWALAEKLAA